MKIIIITVPNIDRVHYYLKRYLIFNLIFYHLYQLNQTFLTKNLTRSLTEIAFESKTTGRPEPPLKLGLFLYVNRKYDPIRKIYIIHNKSLQIHFL